MGATEGAIVETIDKTVGTIGRTAETTIDPIVVTTDPTVIEMIDKTIMAAHLDEHLPETIDRS